MRMGEIVASARAAAGRAATALPTSSGMTRWRDVVLALSPICRRSGRPTSPNPVTFALRAQGFSHGPLALLLRSARSDLGSRKGVVEWGSC